MCIAKVTEYKLLSADKVYSINVDQYSENNLVSSKAVKSISYTPAIPFHFLFACISSKNLPWDTSLCNLVFHSKIFDHYVSEYTIKKKLLIWLNGNRIFQCFVDDTHCTMIMFIIHRSSLFIDIIQGKSI